MTAAAFAAALVPWLAALVALLHLGFLALEMVWWRKPLGRRVFRTDQAFADRSAALAANQGLYNGFLAAGLGWGAWLWPQPFATPLLTFFLGCVVLAGVFGALSVNRRIFWVQAAPALLAAAALFLAGR